MTIVTNTNSNRTIMMIAVINIVLALVALVRDIALALFLGTSAQADALLMAFFLPDNLGNNLLAMAIGISCIPLFTELDVHHGKERMAYAFMNIVISIVAFGLLLAFILFLFREDVIGLMGRGFAQDTKNLAVTLFSVMLPTMLFFPLGAIAGAVSHIRGKFTIPALAPVLFNLVFLVGIIVSYIVNEGLQESVFMIAISITLGVAVMAGIIWVCLIREKAIQFLPIYTHRHYFIKDIKVFMRLFLPYILIMSAHQIVFYTERYLASMLEVGTVAGLNYAFRISQLPVWVFVAALTTFSFPSISKMKEMARSSEVKQSVLSFLKLTLVITLPFSIIIFGLRYPIVKILFEGGAFDQRSIELTVSILTGYAFAIVGQSILFISIRFFMAIKVLALPVTVVLFASAVNIGLNFYLVERIGAAGIGYGAAAGSVVNAVLLILLINKKLSLGLGRKWMQPVRIVLANIPVILMVFLAHEVWEAWAKESVLVLQLTFGAVVGILVFVVYIVTLKLLRCYPLPWTNARRHVQ